MTTFIWTVNASSLLNFIAQRNEEHAQAEMQEYARAVEILFEQVMPETWRAFIEYGRKAP